MKIKNKKSVSENLIRLIIIIVACFVIAFAFVKYLLPALGINLFE
ncbi:MAG: hypothetical protein NZ889_00275 [Candidatus Pacearchaeota archaeon]|nr:hypothetical protein [Candidatus Pacearchaeota archaeon]